MKNYFKVYTDFANYIPIDGDEYEKAIYAFMKGKPVVFKNGAATRIEKILPDYNKMCGWNSDYKITPDEYSEIEAAKKLNSKFSSEVKAKVEYLIATKQEHLIGKEVKIPELEAPQTHALSAASAELVTKFKV
jgi:tryptophan 2,3-dioxygenase